MENNDLSMPEQMRIRYDKREKLLSSSQNPYKNGLSPQGVSSELKKKYNEKSRDELQAEPIRTSVAGRVMGLRDFGKGGFVRIKDRAGEFQLYIDRKTLGEADFEIYKDLDLGDIVYSEGNLFKTKTNELSVHSEKLTMLTKSLRPLPEKFHGLTDLETRYRQRYVDLFMNDDSLEVFRKRAQIIDEVRRYFIDRSFVEVETPMLHPIQGGTIARPFKTHHNTLDMKLFMRIAPELYLKRLLVGGLERVFEMNRNFRNEGMSIKHNPEFTMLEFYQAYATYEDLMPLTQELFQAVADKVMGTRILKYEETEINFDGNWERLPVEDAILKYSGFKDKSKIRDREALMAYGKKAEIHMDPKVSVGDLMMAIFDHEVEKNLIQPTFVTQYPLDVSPLARKNEKDPFLVDRFELYIYGREIANGFSELNDPVDQKARFEKQVEAKKAGNDEACDMDEDYIRALEYGMPPAAGEGIGIDRMVMLFTNASSIRDVILFPLMRPE
jgi:lysyl-tRNA synthetase class 2